MNSPIVDRSLPRLGIKKLRKKPAVMTRARRKSGSLSPSSALLRTCAVAAMMSSRSGLFSIRAAVNKVIGSSTRNFAAHRGGIFPVPFARPMSSSEKDTEVSHWMEDILERNRQWANNKRGEELSSPPAWQGVGFCRASGGFHGKSIATKADMSGT